MSEKPKTVKKVVPVGIDNYAKLEQLAEEHDIHITDYLSYIVNRGIVDEVNRKKAKNPLYIWKS